MSVNNLDVLNIAGYKFEPLDDFEDLVPEFQSICVELELKGSVYLSPNGINSVSYTHLTLPTISLV